MKQKTTAKQIRNGERRVQRTSFAQSYLPVDPLSDHRCRWHGPRRLDQAQRHVRAAGKHQRYAFLDQRDVGLFLDPHDLTARRSVGYRHASGRGLRREALYAGRRCPGVRHHQPWSTEARDSVLIIFIGNAGQHLAQRVVGPLCCGGADIERRTSLTSDISHHGEASSVI